MSLTRSNPQDGRLLRGMFPAAWLLVALLLMPFTATPATAQENAVAGQVVDAETHEPVSDAQFHVVGTQLGPPNQTNDRYLIPNVSGRQVTLGVTRIGYQTHEQTVSVGGGAGTLALEPTVLELDATVVTGTLGTQRVACPTMA